MILPLIFLLLLMIIYPNFRKKEHKIAYSYPESKNDHANFGKII
jgi:hypothetical protein